MDGVFKLFFVVFPLQIAGDSELGVKLLDKSLIKNVQVSPYLVFIFPDFLFH